MQLTNISRDIMQDYKKNKKIRVFGKTLGAGKSTITQIIKIILEIKN